MRGEHDAKGRRGGARRLVRAAPIGVALAVGAAWLAWGLGAAPAAPDLARGAEIYAKACASCHGADLRGQPDWQSPGPDGRLPAPPHDATGHTWHHADRVLTAIIRDGSAAVVGGGYESDMPGFGDRYDEAEIRDVLAYIKSRWPERERLYQEQITAQDEAAR